MSQNPPSRKSTKRSVEVPISVTVKRTARPEVLVQAPVVQQPTKVRAKRAQPKIRSSILRQPVHTLPVEHRKRLMWGMVAIGAFVVVVGWAFTLGHELRQDNREPNLIGQLSNVFRSFKLPGQSVDPNEQEIRQLEEEVFPQF